MGILADILGTGDVVKQGFELIDDLHTSKEEEIAAANKAKVELLTAYHPFKKAQRILALMFAAVFLVSFAITIGLAFGSPNDVVILQTVLNEFYIAEIMFTIIGFYFGGGFLEGSIGKWKSGKA
jgi:hypothetical protein